MKLRKPSDTNRTERQLDLPAVFVDRSLDSPKFKNILRQATIRIGPSSGILTVHSHNELFHENTSDQEWLEKAGQEGWIALTKDFRIRHREPERLAVKAFDVALFTLKTRVKFKAEEMAEIFVRAFPKIVQFLSRNSPPFIAKVTMEGKVLMEVDLN